MEAATTMRNPTATGAAELATPVPGSPASYLDMTWVPGGSFQMGSNRHYPEERPVHAVSVDGFWIVLKTFQGHQVR